MLSCNADIKYSVGEKGLWKIKNGSGLFTPGILMSKCIFDSGRRFTDKVDGIFQRVLGYISSYE